MKEEQAIRLTEIFRREGILSITANGGGYSVYMRGDILGTGETIGEAYQSALDVKAAQSAARVAA